MGWPITPEGFTELLVRLHTDYANIPPIYITENGCAYDDPVIAGRCADPRRIEYLDHPAPLRAALVEGESKIAHHGGEVLEPPDVLELVVLAELDQQDRLRLAMDEGLQRRAEHRDLARKLQHRAVDQLDGDRLQFHQMLRGVHRLVERAEVARADRAAAEHRPQLQLDAGGEAERPFRSDQDVREIMARGIRREGVEIVAADAALHFREARLDLVGLAQPDIDQTARERSQRRAWRQVREAGRDRAEMPLGAVGQHGIDRVHVVAHRAVAQRAAAAGIVRRHAADGRA